MPGNGRPCSSGESSTTPSPRAPQGFRLQEPQVDELLLAVRDLQGVIITADPQLSPEENVEVLLDTVRLLQTGLGVQTQESDALVRDFQALQQETQVRPPACPLARAAGSLAALHPADAAAARPAHRQPRTPLRSRWRPA